MYKNEQLSKLIDLKDSLSICLTELDNINQVIDFFVAHLQKKKLVFPSAIRANKASF